MKPVTPILRTFLRDLGYQLLAMPATILALMMVTTGVSVALSCAVLIIGLPVVLGVFAAFRLNAELERRRAALALRAPIREAYRPTGGGLLRRLRTVGTDPQSWKDLAWLSFAGTFGLAASTLAITAWGTVLGTLTLPAWYWALPRGADYGIANADTLPRAFLAAGLAVLAVPVAYLLVHWMTEGQLRLSRALLSAPREAALTARVQELTSTRAGAVDAAAAELQRIERDLHDGAQARLVALALGLGMAEERFERDPTGARELVGEAREEAKRALAELRDLARGIRPSLLAERGLGPALTALAARSPVPTGVELDVPDGLSPAIETATWFVVSEALANAGKHSGARRAVVRVHGAGGRLHVEVADDGRGGADAGGSGLGGLRKRVQALDGTLAVDSPPGGPTAIRAELPCAS
jgi:signal transduction histidine kinase